MISLKNFKEYMPRQLLNAAQQYLLEGHTIRISENDPGCYDAAIQENNKEHRADQYCRIIRFPIDIFAIIQNSPPKR